MNEQPGKSQSQLVWRPLLLIMAAVAGWGIYHTIGALRSDSDWRLALLKSCIIFACVGGFLGFWALALRSRAKRHNR